MSCHVDDLAPIEDAPAWFPEGSFACRLTADSRAELAEMCAEWKRRAEALGYQGGR